jgi:hypothetical protein
MAPDAMVNKIQADARYSAFDREIEAKTKAKLSGEIDINDMYSSSKESGSSAQELEEEFDLSEEPAKAA